MANNDNLIEFLTPNALEALAKGEQGVKAIVKEMLKAVAVSNELNKTFRATNTPSGFAKNIKDTNKAIEQQIKITEKAEQERERAAAKAIKEAERQRLAEIKLQQDREKAADKYEKNLQREASKLAATESLYNKIQAKLNQLNLEYRDLASKKELGIKLTDEEARRYEFLGQKIIKYDTTLKSVDASMGKYQRNVGNYASGFNPLSNSINQLTREMPAFANSVQTGFMAISNNLPIFFDSIATTQREIKALRAEGQQVPGLFRQLTSSLFSWGTALSVGVTLLTVYGKEMTEFISKLLGGSKALDELKQRQEEFNDARKSGIKDAQEEIFELEKYLAVVKDRNLSDEQRDIALKKLRSNYPFYFKDLTDEQILLGDTVKANEEVMKALEKRKEIEKKTSLNVENRKKLKDLQDEIEISREAIKAQEELAKSRSRTILPTGGVSQGGTSSTGRDERAILNTLIKRGADLQEEYDATQKDIIANEANILQLKKETIALEYQEDKAVKQKSATVSDYFANIYALIQQRLQNEADANARIFDNEEQNYDKREQAARRYHEIQQEMALRQRDEEIRIIKKTAAEQVAELQKQIDEGEVTYKSGAKAIAAIQKQAEFDSLTAHAVYAGKLAEIDQSIADTLKGVWNEINFGKAKNLISQAELENTRAYIKEISTMLQTGASAQDFEEAQKRRQKSIGDTRVAVITAERDMIEAELMSLRATEENVQKRIQLTNQLIEKENELAKAVEQSTEQQVQEYTKAQAALNSYLQKFTSGFFDDLNLSSLSQFFDGTFNSVIKGLDSIENKLERSKAKYTAYFLAITEVAQEAYNFLNQNQQAYFQNQIRQLDADKRVAESFAATEEAKAEVQRQYDEKRREIQIQQAKAQKEQALFNIAINTAQAALAAYASQLVPGDPTSLVRAQLAAIVVAGLGAVQAALVASREIPAYAEGTDFHKGGQAVVGDGGKSELVYEPSKGWSITPNTPTVVDLERGAKVFPDATATLMDAYGLPRVDKGGNSMSKADMMDVMAKTLGSQPVMSMVWDKRGLNSSIRKGRNAMINHNNRISGTGRVIG